MSRVLIIGSGPTGATYARLLIEQTPDVDVLMVEAGPVVSTPPGMNVKNIDDPAEQNRARAASQGRGAHTSGVAALGGTAAEGTVTARFGTYLVGRPAEGSGGLPAAAVSANVGGQGAHWTCATPRPEGSERIDFVPELDELLDEASRLLHVTTGAFGDSPQASAILERIGAEFAGDGVTVRPLPVAADPRPDGSLRWSGTDVVLGPLADGAHADRFELRPETLAVRLLRDDNGTGDRVVGAVLRDQRTGAEEEVRADAVVVAANAFGTPQLLWTSGIRPEALGRYLTEHPLVFGIVAVREGVLPPPDRDGRLQTDPIRGVVSVAFAEGHPFHAQLMYSPVCPVPLPEGSPYRDNAAGYAMVGYGVRKFPRPDDRVTFDGGSPDDNGLPGVVISYDLTEREHAEIEAAKKFQARAAGVLGEFVENMPRLMPPGTSLHFMGTFRMGQADDGTSVCDPDSRVWGVPGLVLAGNGLIPTANSCNPTLTSVALAVRGARALAADLAEK